MDDLLSCTATPFNQIGGGGYCVHLIPNNHSMIREAMNHPYSANSLNISAKLEKKIG